MQKKLLAAAVTGALGAMMAPVAIAQNATVNVYGAVVAEYASIKPSDRTATDPRSRYDQWQNPGSALGFRGEEKLGGGMSAWFQCETTMDYRGSANTGTGATSQGLCNRDSAMGVKGGFGNIFMGNWGTPFKRVTNDMVGANDTGVYGAGRILYGQSSTYSISAPNGTAAQLGLATTPGAWRRRQNNLLSYDTPNFGGFTGMASVTVGNNQTGATNGQLKARLWSIGGQYNNGPLSLGLAYEKHKDFYGVTAAGAACPNAVAAGPVTALSACNGSSESAWVLAGSYTFSNSLKLGAQYSQQKADTSALAQSTKVNTWHVGIDWTISGPHGLRAAYSRAGDVTGGLATAVAFGPAMGQRPLPTAIALGGYSGTGASIASIRYVHMLSKRTELTLGYSRLDNKNNANYEIGGSTTTVNPGSDSNAIAFGMVHKF